MKQKLLATTALGIIILGGVIAPMSSFVGSQFGPRAYAQGFDWNAQNDISNNADITTPQAPQVDNINVDPNQQSENENAPSIGESQNGGQGGGNAPAETKPPEELTCGTNFICSLVLFASYIGTFVPKALATISGILLDYSLWYTIQSSPYVDQDGAGSFVVEGWKLVRDFSNLLFIFALFAIAFSLILNSTGTGNVAGLDPQRTIVRVIMIALIVNFSFFLCRVTIDVTNIFGRMFYEKISSPVDTSSYANVNNATENGGNSLGSTQEFYTNFAGVRSISLGILEKVNPQAMVLQNGNFSSSQSVGQWLVGWKSYDSSVYILILIMTTVTAIFDLFLVYIFITSFIFLIGRTIGLFFFIILSPIAFISTVIPGLQNKAYFGWNDWVTQFTGLAFTAPIYLFFIYLTVLFLKAPLLSKSTTGILATAAIIMIKLFTVGLILIMGKKITQDLSGKIGAATANVAKAGAVLVGAAVTGGAAGFAAGEGVLGTVGSTLRGAGSQVGQLGKRYAMEKGKDLGMATGQAVFGEETFDAMRNSKSWNAATSFKKFNPRAVANVAGIAMGPGVLGDIGSAYRTGKFGNRQYDIAEAKKKADEAKRLKEEMDKFKTRKVDKDIADLKKDREDGVVTKEEYEERLMKLAKEKRLIIDPTFEHKDKLAGANKTLADLEKEKKKANIGDALAKNQLSVVESKLNDSITKLSDVTIKATEATKNRTDGDNAIKAHEADLSKAKKDDDALALKLADIDKQLRDTPKTGFGVDRAKIDNLQGQRNALINDRATIAKTTQATNLDLSKLKEKQGALVTAEKELTKEKASLDEKTQALREQKNTVEKERNDLLKQQSDLDSKIDAAGISIDKAKGELDVKKEEVGIRTEFANRTRTEKTDYGNEQRNEKRIEDMEERFKTITGRDLRKEPPLDKPSF